MSDWTWVIDLGWRAAGGLRRSVPWPYRRAVRLAELRVRRSRQLFAETRRLLADAREVLARTAHANPK